MCKEYGVDEKKIVRPFYPKGDYEKFDYSDGAVVVDNPPFSILSKILDFYIEKNIPFFLFGSGLTLFSSLARRNICAIVIGSTITYENGARVNTGFLTNLDECAVRTSAELKEAIEKAEFETKQTKQLPTYSYPKNVLMINELQKIAGVQGDIKFKRKELCFIRELEAQKKHKKTLYGGGFLISENAVLKIEQARREAEQARRETYIWELSEREKGIIEKLG